MKDYIIKFNKPAAKNHSGFQREALSIGNGFLGISVFGDPLSELIQINEKSLWTGGPSKKRPDYNGGNKNNGYKTLLAVQKAVKEKDILKSNNNISALTGEKNGYGAYQNLGNINLSIKNNGKIKSYERFHNISCGEIVTKFKLDNNNITRKHLACFSHNVILTQITSMKPINFTVDLKLAHKAEYIFCENSIYGFGALEDNNLQFGAFIKIYGNGKAHNIGDKLVIENSTNSYIAFTAETNYSDNYPIYRNGNPKEKIKKTIQAFEKNSIEKIIKNASKYYKSRINKFDIELGGKYNGETSKELLRNYRYGKNKSLKRYLEELLIQYGRACIIGSSYKDEVLPANLQGVWNDSNTPIWSSDYHLNINFQMIYSHCACTGLFDEMQPMLRFMNAQRAPGRITAELYHGIKSKKNEENGFICHTQLTSFGWTCPGWNFYWGWSTAAAAWAVYKCYEYYEYTNDYNTLKNEIYPLIKESCTFYMKNLIYDEKNDRLLSTPTYSPEQGPITNGNTYEQSLIYMLFDIAEKAADIINDFEFLAKIKKIKSKLKPLEINKIGMIKEWYNEDDWFSGSFSWKFMKSTKRQKHHRHVSHLLGLYPGKLFENNETLLLAAEKSLYDRGIGIRGPGWSKAFKSCLWARLKNGDNAYKEFSSLIKHNIYINMKDFHPPFQLDGNCGLTKSACEMILYNGKNNIEFLPALPKEWKNGSIKGIYATNKQKFNFTWENGKKTK